MNEYLEAVRDVPRVQWFGYPQIGGGFGGPLRRDLVDRFSWAVPDDEAVAAVAALSPIVEIGAGRGYWAYLLANAGADVVAYDPKPRGGSGWHAEKREPWFPVQRGNTAAVERHPDRTLLICWPPWHGRMANEALRRYRGDRVAYVGEWGGGCNADLAFFNRLDRDWTEEARIAIPQWEGIRDALWIFRRRGLPEGTAATSAVAAAATSG